MKKLVPDTLLTRFILMVVAALVLAQIIAIVSFKLIAENMFASMRRASQIEVSLQVLELSGAFESVEDFRSAAVSIDGVLFVSVDRQPSVQAETSIASIVRRRWIEREPAGVSPKEFKMRQVSGRPEQPRRPAGHGPGTPPDGPDQSVDGPQRPSGPDPGWLGRKPGPMLTGDDKFRKPPVFGMDRAEMSIRFGEDAWANVIVSSRLAGGPPIQPFIFVLTLSLLAVAISAAFAARWIYKPLNRLAEASAALERGEQHSPLPVSGPRDIRKVMQAFNSMAIQMETTLRSQKDVLVAIGHDLRTPLTSLRVRTAMIEDQSEREKMDRALDQLQGLTEAALVAGRQAFRPEEREVMELGALLQSLCDDLTDIGLPLVQEEVPGQLLVQGWPDDLSRALRNIIENAVRYGARASVRLLDEGPACKIEVDDEGPGIPEGAMARVFEPLVRLESSRNLETGGHGLGLYIARNIIAAHGGTIALQNLAPGGLRVSVILPRYRS